MGYRSEVVISIKAPFNLSQQLREDFCDCDSAVAIKDEKGNVIQLIFMWESVKWYSGYADVDRCMDYIRVSDAAFIRCGEDEDDTEHIGDVSGHGISISMMYEKLIGDPLDLELFKSANSIQFVIGE